MIQIRQPLFSYITIVLDEENIIFDTQSATALVVFLSIFCTKQQYATLTLLVHQHRFQYLFVTITAKEYTHTDLTMLIDSSSFLYITISLNTPFRAAVSCTVFYIAQKKRTLVLDTKQIHTNSHAESSVLVQGIADCGAKVVHTGNITITNHATQTVAKQTSKHITLSTSACVYAKPILDVSQNAVQCSHGSAIGMIQNSMLFYLQSRGYTKKDAMYWLLESMIRKKNSSHTLLHATLKQMIHSDKELNERF